MAAGNTFYTTSQLAGMQDIDQRLTRDIGAWWAQRAAGPGRAEAPLEAAATATPAPELHDSAANIMTRPAAHLPPRSAERLCDELAALIPTLVKPVVDIAWFSWQLWRLTGRRGMLILYLYTALGWGSLR